VPSLHPFYTPGDLAFEPQLLGTWAPKGGTPAELERRGGR
jgi:hypothetical protein